jgi:electron transport complex protein RnfB
MSRSSCERTINVPGVLNMPDPSPKRGRPRLIAVVKESCTGCEACVDFCPVDCIDDVSPGGHAGELVLPIRIREPECIGCRLCAKVCDELDHHAIEMIPVDEPARRSGLSTV